MFGSLRHASKDNSRASNYDVTSVSSDVTPRDYRTILFHTGYSVLSHFKGGTSEQDLRCKSNIYGIFGEIWPKISSFDIHLLIIIHTTTLLLKIRLRFFFILVC